MTSLRIVLVAALLGGIWLIMAGWSTDSPRDRFIDAGISAVVLLFALAIVLPRRGAWALRVVAAVIGLAYVWYVGAELWQMLGGKSQPLRIGQPSALMAGVGFLVLGIPMLIFAFGGIGVGMLERLMNRNPQAPAKPTARDDGSATR